MNNPVQKESIFSQWKKSSPYSQDRLSLLKKIDTKDWNKLIDPDEQREFHLRDDEFLIYSDKYQGVLSDIFYFLHIPGELFLFHSLHMIDISKIS